MNGGEVVFDIKANNDEAKEKIEETGKTAEDMAGNVADAVKKIASALALAKGVDFLADIAKQCVQAYADFEQLTGGVETLFGTASDTVKKNAQDAFLTVGMSANEYMETVTGFSASLIQSLGGDTEKAAEKADRALRDMSDNANKMGSDLESIKSAYAGFSKGQFQLLDNLKLGYGGTKTEMERLLKDAEAISGIKYDVSSYADIIDAIGVIQDKMGITGTTAREASETISGSIQAMKASWQNLLVGIADPEQSVADLTKQLTDSIQTVEHNVMPRLIEIFGNMGDTTAELAEGVLPMIPQAITALLPSVVDGLGSILEAVITNGADLAAAILGYAPKFAESIGQIAGRMGPVVLAAITTIADSAADNADAIVESIIDTVVSFLQNDFPGMNTAALQQAKKIILALVHGIIDHAPELAQAVPDIISSLIIELINFLPEFLAMGAEICNAVAEGIVNYDWGNAIRALTNGMADILDTAQKHVQVALDNIFSGGSLYGGDINNVESTPFIENMRQGVDTLSESVSEFSERWREAYAAGRTEIEGVIYEPRKVTHREEPLAAEMSDYAKSLQAQSENWADTAENTADKVTAAGETLDAALEDLEHKYAVHQIGEEQYWEQRRAILERYRDESDEEWWKLYDQVSDHYEKLAETERKAAESAAKEQESILKKTIEDRFRELETEQLENGYSNEWLLDEENAFIETLDHNSELYKDYHLKLLKTKQSYADKSVKETQKAADEERKSFEKLLTTVQRSQSSLSDSLDYNAGDLFKKEESTDQHTGVKTTKRTVDIAEFERQLSAKKKLTSKIAELLDAGVSDELVRELLKLDPTDALAYATQLLNNPSKLERIKKDFSQDEELSDKLAEMVTKQSSEYADLGRQAGEIFGDGFLDALGNEWQEKLAAIVGNSAVYSAATAVFDGIGLAKTGTAMPATAAAGIGMVNAVLGGDVKLKLVDANGQYVATLVNSENNNMQMQRGS